MDLFDMIEVTYDVPDSVDLLNSDLMALSQKIFDIVQSDLDRLDSLLEEHCLVHCVEDACLESCDFSNPPEGVLQLSFTEYRGDPRCSSMGKNIDRKVGLNFIYDADDETIKIFGLDEEVRAPDE